ncbi:copper-binding protein [Reyranella sp.]|uniref:copper-binding protein n=1 Tax=Reyranella sp. TaxID=1929291 RepID=UPI003BAA60B2
MYRFQPLAGFLLLATLVAANPAFALETLPGEPPVADESIVPVAERLAPPVDEPLARGRVVAVDREARRLTLEYRPVPELFLYGGTRVFAVADDASLKGLGPGDKVRFEVERSGRDYTIRRLENSN